MLIIATNQLISQNWKSTGALAATGSPFYLTCATNVGNNLYVVNANKTYGYSTDFGKTWISSTTTKPKGDFAALTGIQNRLYANMKINSNDNELYFSTNHGQTWTIDTVGLPRSLTKNGILGVILKDMGNNYVLAHENSKAFYKKLDEPKWKPTQIDFVIVDVAATNTKWLAIGAAKILQSTDNGTKWTTITTTGLPAQFQGNKISTNGTRIFVSNAPAKGAQDIYYSDDEGVSWVLTNSGGKYTHTNPWVQNLYAVDDYIFAAILPFGFQDAPPFIMSTSKTPNFIVGDVSGLPTGSTVSNLPFFFHIQNKLYTMFTDLYVSEPGFKGNSSTAVLNMNYNDNSISVQPNPADHSIQIVTKGSENNEIEVFNIQGKKVFQQRVESNTNIDISTWAAGIYFVKSTNQNGRVEQTKFIKK